jgi:hypothetical protein
MRAATTELWRGFLSPHVRIHVYTVDPGAHALAVELVPLIEQMGRLCGWYAEGWSARERPACRAADQLPGALSRGDSLILGSQTNFARTQSMIRATLSAGASPIFLFDHWKNFSDHFGTGPLPDVIVVPDDMARDLLLVEIGAHAAPVVKVLPHLAIEAAADRVRGHDMPRSGMIALLLDPTEPADELGYDWRTTLAAAAELAAERQGLRILVKPHPRQNVDTVTRELISRRGHVSCEIFQGDTERLVAAADEVWGMTTVVLNVALAAGKPIRSLQIGRNDRGRRASNPHIEPFVITELRSAT